MAESDIAICNMALAHLADGKGIASFTERSAEARASLLWYEQTRDELLREFPWPFAQRRGALTLIAVLTGVTGAEWGYSYRVPAGTLAIRSVLSPYGFRIPSHVNRVPWLLESDATGQVLYTDLQDAQLVYTLRVTDVAQYPADFTRVLALKLAANMAPALTAGDPQKLGNRALQLAEMELSKAKATALNEQLPDRPADSEFIAARDDEFSGIVPPYWGGW